MLTQVRKLYVLIAVSIIISFITGFLICYLAYSKMLCKDVCRELNQASVPMVDNVKCKCREVHEVNAKHTTKNSTLHTCDKPTTNFNDVISLQIQSLNISMLNLNASPKVKDPKDAIPPPPPPPIEHLREDVSRELEHVYHELLDVKRVMEYAIDKGVNITIAKEFWSLAIYYYNKAYESYKSNKLIKSRAYIEVSRGAIHAVRCILDYLLQRKGLAPPPPPP